MPALPGIPHLKDGIFKVFENKSALHIQVQPLVGAEFIGFMKVSLVVLRGYVFCVQFVFFCVIILFSRAVFPDNWRKAWVQLLHFHFMYAERPYHRSEYKIWEKVAVQAIDTILQVFGSVMDNEGNQAYSTSFIYAHQLRDHFVKQIQHLGPPPIQNTQLFEKQHQVVKVYTDTASTKSLHESMMNQV